jgi:hypothetical protein
MARLKVLLPDIQKAEAANHPLSPEVKLHASEAQEFARKKDFGQANSVLDKVETLVKQVLAQPPGTAPSAPPSPAGNGAARFMTRLKALLPDIQKAEAANHQLSPEVKLHASEAQEFARKKDFDQANAVLDNVETLVKQVLTSTPPSQTPPGQTPHPGSSVLFTQTRLAWDHTRKKIQAELKKLEQSILSVCLDPDLEQNQFDFSTLAADTKSLYTILDNLDERLIDKLDDAQNASDPAERNRLQTEAGKIVQEYLAFLDSNDLMKVIDDNGFAPVAVRKSALDALHLIASKL